MKASGSLQLDFWRTTASGSSIWKSRDTSYSRETMKTFKLRPRLFLEQSKGSADCALYAVFARQIRTTVDDVLVDGHL